MKELNTIQVELRAPKDLENTFGGYKYRSLESILEALKPLLKKTGCAITFADDVRLVGDRYYVHTTCTLTNAAGESVVSTALAREQEAKKGMDEAQITGSASSYARKYAICSLLAIDDNREPDMMDNRDEGAARPKTPARAAAKQPAGTTAQPTAKGAPTGRKRAITPEELQRLVAAQVAGQRMRTGETPRQWYIDNCNPGPEQIWAFDAEVTKAAAYARTNTQATK